MDPNGSTVDPQAQLAVLGQGDCELDYATGARIQRKFSGQAMAYEWLDFAHTCIRLQCQGYNIIEISKQLGRHPDTVARAVADAIKIKEDEMDGLARYVQAKVLRRAEAYADHLFRRIDSQTAEDHHYSELSKVLNLLQNIASGNTSVKVTRRQTKDDEGNTVEEREVSVSSRMKRNPDVMSVLQRTGAIESYGDDQATEE